MVSDLFSNLLADISTASRDNLSKILLRLFKSITPQFYRNASVESLQDELLGISLLINHIDNQTLLEMCKRALNSYSVSKSQGKNCNFNIDYVLSFYNDSYDFVHSDNVKLSKNAQEIDASYDNVKNIKTQVWLDNGQEVTTSSFAFIGDCGGVYSKKDFELNYTDLDNLVF